MGGKDLRHLRLLVRRQLRHLLLSPPDSIVVPLRPVGGKDLRHLRLLVRRQLRHLLLSPPDSIV
ncbi:hypothetical protein ACWD3J_46970, partial [Streptomyces sp. NPDC002755]|uniref:hypothetical protein n=1 Tax=Streptomyces sp. NPDC002884 TaxID=3154544 RepID=UPI00331ECF82